MQERIRVYFQKLLDRWKAFTKRQKTQIIVITVSLVAVIVFVAWLALRPQMEVIATRPSVAETTRIQAALSAAGINSRTDAYGTQILVNKNDVGRAIAYIEENNVINDPGFTYQNALDASTMGTTESVKAENFRKAKETDLANVIKLFDGVRDARVTLVIPGESSFLLSPEQKSSASVQVTTDYDLGTKQGEMIARFVSHGVKNLAMEDVEVVDSNWNTLYSSGMSLLDGGLSSRADAEMVLTERYENNIKKTLRPIYPEVQVLASFTFDWDKISERSVEYSLPTNDEESNTGLVSSDSRTQSSWQGGTQGEEPGVYANDQQTETYQQGTASTSSGSSKTNDTQYLYNSVEAIKDSEIGKFLKDNSSLAVYVYDYVTYQEAEAAALGLYGTGTDYATWTEFKAAQPKRTPFPADDEIIVSLRNTLSIGTGIQNLEVVGYKITRFEDRIVEPVRIAEFISYGIVILLILLLAYALLKKTQPDEVTEIEPTLTVEDMLISTKHEEEKKAEAERLRDIEFGVESEVRKQINKFVGEKPEAVAQLLRNWLSEDWE